MRCLAFVAKREGATCLACDRAPWDGHDRLIENYGGRLVPWRPGLVTSWLRSGLIDAARAEALRGYR